MSPSASDPAALLEASGAVTARHEARRMATDFQVRRTDLRTYRFVEAPASSDVPVAADEALLRVDSFAFTANNVTYGALGDSLNYWDFFPAPEGWGRIPAWGFGTVLSSPLAEVAPGTRYYGYFPMSSYVAFRPGRATATTFGDAAPHRASLHPLYNQYTLTPPADDLTDALQLLYRPLYITSFILDDYFDEHAYFGARRVLVSSASSKTAYGMAFLMSQRLRAAGATVELVGLTSPGNVAFVEDLGFYDRVVAYDAVSSLPADEPAIYIDFAANARLRRAVHAHLADKLAYSGSVGLTHWDQNAATSAEGPPLPGAAPTTFFAPAQIKKRIGDWGSEGFAERFDRAWALLVRTIREHGTSWLSVTRGGTTDDLARVYEEALAGKLSPNEGHVLRLP